MRPDLTRSRLAAIGVAALLGAAIAHPAGAQGAAAPDSGAIARLCAAIDADLAPLILSSGATGDQVAAGIAAWRDYDCGSRVDGGRAAETCGQVEEGWRAMQDDNRRFRASGAAAPYKAWQFAQQAALYGDLGCVLVLDGGGR